MIVPGGFARARGRGSSRGSASTRLQGALLYREVQGFGWPWPGMLIVLLGVVTFTGVLVLFGFGMWQQLVRGRPWGDKPIPDAALAIIGPFAILSSLLPLAVLFSRLAVEVRHDGIRIQMVGLRRPQILPRDDVREAALAHISPLNWGSSRHGGRLVYHMAGSEGVLVELTNGGKIVIGSEHPRRLLDAVRSMLDTKPRR